MKRRASLYVILLLDLDKSQKGQLKNEGIPVGIPNRTSAAVPESKLLQTPQKEFLVCSQKDCLGTYQKEL